jgi:hypothetical protein
VRDVDFAVDAKQLSAWRENWGGVEELAAVLFVN